MYNVYRFVWDLEGANLQETNKTIAGILLYILLNIYQAVLYFQWVTF